MPTLYVLCICLLNEHRTWHLLAIEVELFTDDRSAEMTIRKNLRKSTNSTPAPLLAKHEVVFLSVEINDHYLVFYTLSSRLFSVLYMLKIQYKLHYVCCILCVCGLLKWTWADQFQLLDQQVKWGDKNVLEFLVGVGQNIRLHRFKDALE